MYNQHRRIQVCSSIPLKPLPVAGFIFSNSNCAKSVPSLFHYRKPRLVKGKKRWYIQYYYRIPVDVRKLYDNKEFLRFKIFEDINRRSGAEKEQYAEWLLFEIEDSLKKGYNPFDPEKQKIEDEALPIEEKTELNASDAMLLFLEEWGKRGLEGTTLQKYTKVITRFIDWLHTKSIPYTDINNITQAHVLTFLQDMKKKFIFGNREFNNHRDFIRTAFNYFLRKKYITSSPMVGIEKMKSNSTKHRFFDDKSLSDITTVLQIEDPYTYLAFQTVYYLCVRSEKELKNLKIGNISWSQNKVLADVTKGKSERYIPLDNNLKELFIKHGIDKYPDDHYVFGIKGVPSPVPFGKGFFSKRFAKHRDLAGLSDKFSLYGAKHTRVVHLKQDGATDADIMSLTGHTDFTAYAKYLRDIGMAADADKINRISRKI